MFGLLLPVLLAIVGAGIDFSFAEDAKVRLQDAADAAGLAVSAEVVKNPNETVPTLKSLAQNTMQPTSKPDAARSRPLSASTFARRCRTTAQTASRPWPTTPFHHAQTTAPCLPLPIPTTVCQSAARPARPSTQHHHRHRLRRDAAAQHRRGLLGLDDRGRDPGRRDRHFQLDEHARRSSTRSAGRR